jgi:YfiH family protein
MVIKKMKQFISEIGFLHKHFTTTKAAGDMKDKKVRDNFFISINLNPANLVLANQCHGNNVKIVDSSNRNSFVDNCDGLVTNDKDIMLGIFTADCIPLLIFDENSKVKVAVHAGWKSVYRGIIENTFDILQNRFAVKFHEIVVYIGPHIRLCCYKVDNKMEIKFNVKLIDRKLDLSLIVCDKLKKFGVNKIFDVKCCTFHDKSLFFSYRRDCCVERMISVIV